MLIISQEFIQRNVLYSRGRRSRPIGIGNYAVKGYGHRCGPASPVILAQVPPWVWFMCLTHSSPTPSLSAPPDTALNIREEALSCCRSRGSA